MEPINVVIADDLKLFREALPGLLSHEQQIRVTGEAANGVELINRVREQMPQVVVTDIQMPGMDGITATKEIIRLFPGIGVIALTMFNEEHLIIDMLEAGAKGYLSKNSSREDLADAIKSVYNGGYYFCNSTSVKLSRMIAASRAHIFPIDPHISFSSKEKEIMQLICQEYSSKQIAPLLQLSQRTVENYRNKIIEKTGAKNVAGVIVYAMKHGIYKPEGK